MKRETFFSILLCLAFLLFLATSIQGEPVKMVAPGDLNETGRALYVNGKSGDDSKDGLSPTTAFKTINKAAQEARSGDTVKVAEGLYREHVKPARGGAEDSRIIYKAVGEVIIKGSERIPTEHDGKTINWIRHSDNVWKTVVPNSFFEEPAKGGRGSGGWTNGTSNSAPNHYNPFRQDQWKGGSNSTGWTAGDVYLNNVAYYQKNSIKDVEDTKKTWYYEYSDTSSETTIYANFGAVNPNDSRNLVEINVRRQNFASDVWGLHYITVDGFTMMHAGNWYSDFPDQPERAQRGAISVYGGKGWIIENNTIVNARSIGVDVGLGCDMWGNNRGTANKPLGFGQTNFRNGDTYGHHIVRNNYISRCGQSGIVGVFSWKSQILYNHIEDTNYRNEFSGSETGGIKLHFCNYGLVEGNYIRNLITNNGGGIWVDWGNQGIRVTRNIVVNSPWPFYAEALHGPVLVDNNIFMGSNQMRTLDATGVVYANNLIARLNSAGTELATSGYSINIDGNGRNCSWYTPGTMILGAGVNPTKQDFWWYNNIATCPIPDTNSSGYIKTHNKHNTTSSAISNFQFTANSGEVSLSFNLSTGGMSLVLATKDEVGMIMFPNSNSNPTYTVGEHIPANVTHDFFGKAYITGAAVSGPFANAVNGANNFTLWPIQGQITPPAMVINDPPD